MFLLNPYKHRTPTDPQFVHVISLLHFDSDFSDQKGKVWTAHNAGGGADPVISSAQSVFGGASGHWTTQVGWIDTPQSTDWNFGTTDFCFELAVRFDDLTGTQHLCGQSDAAGSGASVQSVTIQKDASNKIVGYGCAGSSVIGQCTSTTTVVADRWYRICFQRTSSVDWRLFVDGVLEATTSQMGSINSIPAVFSIGNLGILSAQSQSLRGYVDEWRVTKDMTRYLTSYTPAIAPFPDA